MSAKVNVKVGAPGAQQPEADTADNVVVDVRGRRLVIEQPDFLTESRIMRALGDAASNQHYVLAYVMPAVMVTHIDGVFVPFPTTNVQIEAAIARLGREGMVAVLTHIEEKAKAAHARAEGDAAANAEAEALKNS
ncbi:MAG: hypothetical protein OSB38_28815 [Paraburkholderia fungorum]|nr:hypothetical protein [Paraburkholderia fungorum]